MSDNPMVISPDHDQDQAATVHRPTRHRADILFTFAVALFLYTAWQVHHELVLIYVSALFAVVFMPVLKGIMKLRIGKWSPGRRIAVLILFLAIAAGITLFCLLAIPPVVHDLRDFTLAMPRGGPSTLSRIRALPVLRHVDVAAIYTKLEGIGANLATYVLLSIRDWAKALFDVIIGIVLTVYFMLEGETAYFWVLSFFPVDMRRRLNTTLGRAEVRMGKWLLGQGTLMLILGVTSTIVFRLLHVRYAYALGVIMGLFNLVPVIGALVSVSLVLLVAAIDSWGRVLGVLIFYAVYAQIETSYLVPRIMSTSVDLAGLAVIIALLLGSAIAGVVGAMVAVPTAVLIAVLLNEYLVEPDQIIATSGPSADNRRS